VSLAPNIPRDLTNPRFASEVSDTLTRLHQQVQQQQMTIERLRTEQATMAERTSRDTAGALDLEATGLTPLNLEGLLGQAGQPQKAYLPRYPTLPTRFGGDDPYLQAGAEFVVGTVAPYTPYRVKDDLSGAEVIGGSGTVTSVGITPSFPLIAVGSPVTGSGNISLNFFKSPMLIYGLTVTPVTVNAASTADQNLQAINIATGDFNSTFRTVHVWGAGVFSTDAVATPTLTFKLKLGPTVLVTITSGAADAGKTNAPWNFDIWFTVVTAGSGGVVEAHGRVMIDLTTSFLRGYADTNTGTVSTIDFTAALTLQATVAFSVADADNACTMRQMVVEYGL
jgi:hypothetical protein